MKHRTRLPLPIKTPSVQLWMSAHFGAEYRFDSEPYADPRVTWRHLLYVVAAIVLMVAAAWIFGTSP